MSGTELRLPFREPFAWDVLLDYLSRRAVAGVERVEAGVYRRSVAGGIIEIGPAPEGGALLARLHGRIDAGDAARRLRRQFDLDADPASIAAVLGHDPVMAPLVAARPGLRVPGAWDAFELAVRAVLGQQISVAAATTLAGRLVAGWGEDVPEALRRPGVERCFPAPASLAGADLRAIGLPAIRARSLAAFAAAAAADPGVLEPAETLEATEAKLVRLPGIGPWTANYIAMRALRFADAFPAADLGLLRAMAEGGVRPTPATLARRAEAWRPFRAYAALHLWAHDAEATVR